MKKLQETLNKIKPIDTKLLEKTQKRLDNLTKPLGSLGRLEETAKKVTAVTGKDKNILNKKMVFTLAADHGIVEEGVSAYPKEVTPQMVYNFLSGGAGINVLSNHIGAEVTVVDMGVAVVIQCLNSKNQNFKDKKIALGTKNFAKGPAMTREDAIKSIETGIELSEEAIKNGVNLIATGEMGIGNTTPAAAITSVICNEIPEKVTGRGTGITDKFLQVKINVIKEGIKVNKPNPHDGLDVLSKIGGFEIGGMAGIMLGCIANNVPVIIDGFISGSAALIAAALKPEIKDYLIAGHCSQEPGHKIQLQWLGLKPLLDLDLRLGEGTGAALAMNIVDASCKILNEMATFESAGVSQKDDNK
ncbi:MAG: nicotinate-nucleotide--dimethylbenzimidazole phosphoribosyltransferase [Elusimicrobia bacterium RIFOXYA2_FULL_39_19]|nr:MAG: nicotinate-nucleotide--dimethylbenzimidazole phosphoribosyltransferase [Elusimicrobia bacterium RIFOXYA2_FULL_39_19]